MSLFQTANSGTQGDIGESRIKINTVAAAGIIYMRISRLLVVVACAVLASCGGSDRATPGDPFNPISNPVTGSANNAPVTPAGNQFQLLSSNNGFDLVEGEAITCLLYTSPSPRDRTRSRMPSSA